MSRHHRASSYGQRIQAMGADHYRLRWTVDFYYPGSRQRHPRFFWRDTDQAGARRFATKWRVPMPAAPNA